MNFFDQIIQLTKQLLPTGRAWKVPVGGDFEKLIRALAVSEAQFYEDARSILHSLLPDNDNFTEDDATDWEERLGLITNVLVPLAERKLAIKRKLAYPGKNPAKSHFKYIEDQLQKAGFNVYVYENIFPVYPTGFESVSPVTINPNIFSEFQLNDQQLGNLQLGGYINNQVINHISEDVDLQFDVGNNFRCSFFISADPLGTYADVPLARKDEFRQMILRLKQVQNVAYLFINYI